MNQTMQSFLLKTICCILIIHVTLCSSCYKSVCKARCYFKHSGFDFGYCENGTCKCAPPVIYVFDGIGRDLSDAYINYSLINNNVIQDSVPISRPSASDSSDKTKKNKQKKNGAENVDSKNDPILNGALNPPPMQETTVSTQAAPEIAQGAPLPEAAIPEKVTKRIPSSRRNKVPTTKPDDNKKEKIYIDLSDENNKDSDEPSDESYKDSDEPSDEENKQNSPKKLKIPKDKAGENPPAPVKKEKPDDSSDYELVLESYEPSSDENNAREVVNNVP